MTRSKSVLTITQEVLARVKAELDDALNHSARLRAERDEALLRAESWENEARYQWGRRPDSPHPGLQEEWYSVANKVEKAINARKERREQLRQQQTPGIINESTD